jgi:hypothetical protein
MRLPLRLQLKPSRSYFAFLAGGHILAGVAVCFLPGPGVLRAAMILLLAMLLLRQWHAHSRRLSELLLRADGRVEVLSGTEAMLARVAEDSVVWPWLVILHVDLEAGGRRNWVLFPDGLESGQHRQLRLWLRWRSAGGVN